MSYSFGQSARSIESRCMVKYIDPSNFRKHENYLHFLWFLNTSERQGPGGRLNIKMPSYQYRDSHVKDKTVSPTILSLTWESPYLGKIVFILRRGPVFLHIQCHGFWCPGVTSHQQKISHPFFLCIVFPYDHSNQFIHWYRHMPLPKLLRQVILPARQVDFGKVFLGIILSGKCCANFGHIRGAIDKKKNRLFAVLP